MISLTKGHDSYVYFCSALAAPLIDSIWILTEVIQNLLPSCKQQEVDLNVLILKAMEVTRMKQEEGKIHYAYVANNQMIRNTIEDLVLAGVLSKRKEGSIYYISLSSNYSESERLMSLNESINDLRVDLKKIAEEKTDDYDNEVELTEDVINLMVDVQSKKKGRK